MTQNSPNLNRNGDATAFANFRTRSKGGLKFKTYFQFNSIQYSLQYNSMQSLLTHVGFQIDPQISHNIHALEQFKNLRGIFYVRLGRTLTFKRIIPFRLGG